MAEHSNPIPQSANALLEQLARSLDGVGVLIESISPDQWNNPTPCSEWDVRRVVDHVVGMNRVFTALLTNTTPPRRDDEPSAKDPVTDYRDSSADLLRAFRQPGALERHDEGPMGSASGADRLQIRLYDLLAHGWDLARATGRPWVVPEETAGASLDFARTQLACQPRVGRFAPPTAVDDEAPALERLVAFLGRVLPGT